jgi:endonuclease/exonuclease/phosphatase family metal-dependent hydrolase
VKYFNFIIAIILTIVYAVGKIPPTENYNLWLTNFTIPFALFSNAILLIIALIMRKKSSLYYLIAFIVGSNYLVSTLGIRGFFYSDKLSTEPFSVLSYNVNYLRGHHITPYDFDRLQDSATLQLRQWILDHPADIQCYQEFVNYAGSKKFDLVQLFKEKGLNTYFSYDSIHEFRSVVFGMAITSRFPIVECGDVISSENGFNRIIFADLKIDEDTVRIVNVHLESMGLKKYHPVYTSGFASRKENTKIILGKLKVGVFERSRQIKKLADFVEASPHPVVVSGDFNDLPYSYSYQFMKKKMRNTFEESGKGFGFTYNGKTLRVLRIDNQFYSSGLQSVDFETFSDIKFTDHFPIEGVYKLKPN